MEYTFYRIYCKDETISECYVGSTKNYKKRKDNHKYIINNCDKQPQPVHIFINENGGIDKWDFEVLGKGIYDNENDVYKTEREWIEKYDNTLNNQIPSRTKKEYQQTYRDENKEEYLKKCKEYNNKRKEEHSKYYLDNKEKIQEYKKQHYLKNKEKIQEYKRQHYLKNKEKLKQKARDDYNKIKGKVTCVCGSNILNINLKKHYQSKKHKNWVLNQDD